jgi:small subunit ribosomal protein S4
MGDPKFSKRKYEKPSHPWEGERIKAENELLMKFGLKNKRELWRAQSFIRTLRAQSRELQARLRTGDKQAEIETKELLQRCGRLALLPPEGTSLNDVLALNTEAVLQRRFQTVIYRKGLAFTPKQARQFIVHGHASIASRKVTIPGYLVKRGEEDLIEYHVSSPISNELHPVRPKPEDIQKIREAEQTVKEEEKDDIKVAKPKLKKIIKTELKQEKEESTEPEPEPEEPAEE